MNILGINAYHGDASACIVRDGRLVAAIAEERLNRVKHCAGFPSLAIQACLSNARLNPADIDHIAVSRNPSSRIHERVLEAAFNVFPRTITVKDQLAHVNRTRDLEQDLLEAIGIPREALRATFHNVEHHRAHLASAFFVSPFEDSAVLSIDYFGDFVSTMSAHGQGSHIEVLDSIEYPHSLGLFYTALSQYLGFQHYGDEGKVMGLAPYGTPRYLDRMREIVCLRPGGRFELNLDYFTHHSHGVEMLWDSGTPVLRPVWSAAFAETFGPVRKPGDPLERRHQDMAASLQAMLEEALVHICGELHRRAPVPRLCLAGGVALNCTFNGAIRQRTPFQDVFIQPAAGDDGSAIGAAYYVHCQLNGAPRSFVMEHACFGAEYSDDIIEELLQQRQALYHRCGDTEEMVREVAALIAAGAVVGWFQGPMEFGPRALGNRSILVDPRRSDMREVLNHRIKQRETFRPFGLSILLEHLSDYFEQDYPSPFMLMAYKVRPEKRAELPAVTHVDGTGRLQTVERTTSSVYWALHKAFDELTGCPVLLNTSFNENEPIVCTPEDALNCFLKTRMDVLVMGQCIVRKVTAPGDEAV